MTIYADVSWYQNCPQAGKYLPIDWERMTTQGVGGVYIKASQGLFLDRQLIRNSDESKNYLSRGFYHPDLPTPRDLYEEIVKHRLSLLNDDQLEDVLKYVDFIMTKDQKPMKLNKRQG